MATRFGVQVSSKCGTWYSNFITQYWWVHPNKDEIDFHCCDTALAVPVMLVSGNVFKRFEKFSLNFSISSFEVPVNPFHPQPSLFLYGLLLSLWCFSIFVKYYFQLSFNLKEIFVHAQNNPKYRDCALQFKVVWALQSIVCLLIGKSIPRNIAGSKLCAQWVATL